MDLTKYANFRQIFLRQNDERTNGYKTQNVVHKRLKMNTFLDNAKQCATFGHNVPFNKATRRRYIKHDKDETLRCMSLSVDRVGCDASPLAKIE